MTDPNTTPAVPAAPAAAAPAAATTPDYDVIIAVDRSGTMRKTDAGASKNLRRYDAVKEVACAIAEEMLPVDKDGITVISFGSTVEVRDNCKGAGAIENVFLEFRPMGNTNTEGVLDEAFRLKPPATNPKPVCLIIFTDGAPDNPAGVAQKIVNVTKTIPNRSKVGILFVQVGNEEDAEAYLGKLDNDLTKAGAAHDVVAVVKMEKLETLSPADILRLPFTR